MSVRQSSIDVLIAREKHDFLVCNGNVVDTLAISVYSIRLVTNLPAWTDAFISMLSLLKWIYAYMQPF
jgi:hypothetical protein